MGTRGMPLSLVLLLEAGYMINGSGHRVVVVTKISKKIPSPVNIYQNYIGFDPALHGKTDFINFINCIFSSCSIANC